jgi:hypothetical protein
MAAVFRPAGVLASALADLAHEANALAGGGHWVHGEGALHLTIRAFDPYRSAVRPDDPDVTAFSSAVREAVDGLPPASFVLHGLSPHPRGVAVVAEKCGDVATTLRCRLREAVMRRGLSDLERDHVRVDWYINLLHFAAPVPDPRAVAAWCDATVVHETVQAPFVDLVAWRWGGTTVHPVVLGRAELSASGRNPP